MLSGFRGWQEFACQLFSDELVVRKIAVEGFDDVVPVAPCVWILEIFVAARGVTVSGHIQPVTPPSLAVARRSQEALHDPSESLGRAIGVKILYFFRSRRQ